MNITLQGDILESITLYDGLCGGGSELKLEQHLDLLYRGISRPGAWHDFADNLCHFLDCEEVLVSLVAKPHQDAWWLDTSEYVVTLNIVLSPACLLRLILRRAEFKPVFSKVEITFLTDLGPHLERALRLGLENTATQPKWLSISRFLSELHIAMVCVIDEAQHINEYAKYLLEYWGNESPRFLNKMIYAREQTQNYVKGVGVIECSPFRDDDISGFIGYVLPPKIEDELTTKYSLTKTEKYIARLLAEGFSLDEIAELTNRSKETTRTHSKKIYKKISVKGQVELVNLIARLQISLKRLK